MLLNLPDHGALFDQELARASAALGRSPLDLVHYVVDWNGNEQWAVIEGGGSSAVYTTAHGESSRIRVASGATASSQAFAIVQTSIGRSPPCVPPGVNGEWYMAARFKLETVPDVQTQLAGIGSASETLCVGAFQNASFFRAIMNTGNVVSTKALDTADHTHRLVRKAGSTLWTIDDTDGVSADMYPSTAGNALSVYARNGTTAANQSILSDWIFIAYPRP